MSVTTPPPRSPERRRGTLIVLPVPVDPGGGDDTSATAARPRPPRLSRRRVLLLLTSLVVVLMLPSVYLLPAAPQPQVVVAALPYWNLQGSGRTVLGHEKLFSHVSPWMYGVAPGGAVESQVPEGGTQAQEISRLRAKGVPLMPTIANHRDGKWEYGPVAQVLHDPAVRAQHVSAIVHLVVQEGYLGVDIDYEDLHAEDRGAFSAFVTQLADALHARRKLLSVAVFAKPDEQGYDERNVAQDYAALGRAADEIRLMAYDRHWSTSGPGPVAPIGWVRDVLRYAVSQIPREKILLGIPLYGYDWVGRRGEPVSWLQVYGRADHYGAKAHWDQQAKSPWLRYRDDRGRRHVVWFENAESNDVKLHLARALDLRGVFFWVLGDEDARTWTTVRDTLDIRQHGA